MASSTAAAAPAAPAKRMERAHQMYREGRYEEALGLYSESLGTAKTRSHKIALHTNRAACFFKLHLLNKSLAPIPEAEAELEEEDEGKELPEPEIVEEVQGEKHVDSEVRRNQDDEVSGTNPSAEVYAPQTREQRGIIQTEFKRMTSNPKP